MTDAMTALLSSVRCRTGTYRGRRPPAPPPTGLVVVLTRSGRADTSGIGFVLRTDAATVAATVRESNQDRGRRGHCSRRAEHGCPAPHAADGVGEDAAGAGDVRDTAGDRRPDR